MKAEIVRRDKHLVVIAVTKAKKLVATVHVEPDCVEEVIHRIEQEPRIIYKDHEAPDA